MHNKQLPACCFQRKDGTRCKATPQNGNRYCFFHDPARENERAAARRAGGIAAHRPGPGVVLPPRPLRTPADVLQLLGESIELFRRGAVDIEFCVGLGSISRTLLRAFEMTAREQGAIRPEEV